jgi:serine/threonine protein kinase
MSADLGLVQLGEIVAERYRIEGRLGEGGFGGVYRAALLSTGQRVAIKVLHAHLTNDASRHRFEREARLARQLTHPNTVRLLDFGETGRGFPFIAFELLPGEALSALMRRPGALPPARVARIAAQVLKSLMEAHALGIVHRDIKPANLFLCDYSGAPDFVKVLDFGIAKRDSPYTKALTREDEIIGTPAYMAPEHIAGRPLTGSADLYALGLVMAELLSGTRIYRGDGIAICMEQLSDQPVPLPAAALAPPLGAIVQRATQKSAAYRYPTAADMLRDLEQAESALHVFPEAEASQLLTMQRSPTAPPRAPLATHPESSGPYSAATVSSGPQSAVTMTAGTHSAATIATGTHPLAPSSAAVAAWTPASAVVPGPAKRSRLGRVIMLFAAAFVLLTAGGAGVIAYQRYDSAPSPAKNGASSALGKSSTPQTQHSARNVAPGVLKGLDKTTMAERAKRAGYSVDSATDGPQAVIVQLHDKATAGYVVLYNYPGSNRSQVICNGDPDQHGVLAGTRCLLVRLFFHGTRDPDPAAEPPLMNALLHAP